MDRPVPSFHLGVPVVAVHPAVAVLGTVAVAVGPVVL